MQRIKSDSVASKHQLEFKSPSELATTWFWSQGFKLKRPKHFCPEHVWPGKKKIKGTQAASALSFVMQMQSPPRRETRNLCHENGALYPPCTGTTRVQNTVPGWPQPHREHGHGHHGARPFPSTLCPLLRSQRVPARPAAKAAWGSLPGDGGGQQVRGSSGKVGGRGTRAMGTSSGWAGLRKEGSGGCRSICSEEGAAAARRRAPPRRGGACAR